MGEFLFLTVPDQGQYQRREAWDQRCLNIGFHQPIQIQIQTQKQIANTNNKEMGTERSKCFNMFSPTGENLSTRFVKGLSK